MATTNGVRKTFFEEWAIDYDELRNKSFLEKSKKTMDLIVERYKHNKHSFLELGLGTGEGFKILSKRFKFSCATDISEGMVRRSHLKAKTEHNILVSDGCYLPLKNDSFDFIICQDVIEHVPDQKKLVLEIGRVLRSNGIAIITTPNPLWAPVLYLAEKFRLKVEEGEHEFIVLPRLIKNSLYEGDCNLLSERPFMMFPVKSGLDKFIESLANRKIFARLGFSQMCIIEKK